MIFEIGTQLAPSDSSRIFISFILTNIRSSQNIKFWNIPPLKVRIYVSNLLASPIPNTTNAYFKRLVESLNRSLDKNQLSSR